MSHPKPSDMRPVVLVFAGHDPTSGAGVAADLLTLASLGCHPCAVVTAVTAQDSLGVKEFRALEPGLVIEQARAILEDMPVAAFKVGMLANSKLAAVVAGILSDYPRVPLVLDPVQRADGGDALSEEPLDQALRALLLPRTTLLTPNSLEARALAPEADTLDAAAHELMSLGCEHVLLTGTHEPTPEVIHRLFGHKRLLETFSFKRLPQRYHGSGCTLAAACAGGLAHGLTVVNAASEALKFTWQALAHAYRPGMGQHLPHRLYWADTPVEK